MSRARHRGRRRAGAFAALALAALLAPRAAAACAVCFGAADAAMTEGMNNGILTLLGFVALVQGGFVALFWRLSRRTRRLRERRRSFRVLDGGAT